MWHGLNSSNGGVKKTAFQLLALALASSMTANAEHFRDSGHQGKCSSCCGSVPSHSKTEWLKTKQHDLRICSLDRAQWEKFFLLFLPSAGVAQKLGAGISKVSLTHMLVLGLEQLWVRTAGASWASVSVVTTEFGELNFLHRGAVLQRRERERASKNQLETVEFI